MTLPAEPGGVNQADPMQLFKDLENNANACVVVFFLFNESKLFCHPYYKV